MQNKVGLPFLLINLVNVVFFCHAIDIWKPVTVSNAQLTNSSLMRQSFQSSSDAVCAMAASRLKWANLLRYSGGICQVSSLMAVPYNTSQSPILDPVECLTKLDGCIFNNTVYAIGDIVITSAPYYTPTKCQNGTLNNSSAVVFATPTSCSSPFQQVNSYGCFYQQVFKGDYLSAYQYCAGYEAHLWTFSQNQTIAYYCDAAKALGSDFNDFWIGVYGRGNYFYFLDGAQLAVPPTFWDEPLPSTPLDGLCVRTATYCRLNWMNCSTLLPTATSPRVVCQQGFY